MKTITNISPSLTTTRGPDFAGRPKGVKLEYIATVAGFGKVNIRPIRLDDEAEMIRFHKDLSEESIYMRYFQYVGLDRRTSHERLVHVCTNTPTSYAFVVEQQATNQQPAAILGVGRLTKSDASGTASFATLIMEEEKVSKLGKFLLNSLIKTSRAFGFKVLKSELLVIDHETINLCRELGFGLQTIPQDGIVHVQLAL